MARAWSLVLAVLCAGCALATDPGQGGLDRDVQVRLGEQVTLDGGRLTLGFREVPSDSRCPVDAQCAWAGEAVVALAVAGTGRQPETLVLRTTPGRDAGAYGGYRIELRSLDPRPRLGGTTAETPYVTLRVREE